MKIQDLTYACLTAVLLLVCGPLCRGAAAQSSEPPAGGPALVNTPTVSTTPADAPQQTELSRILRDSPDRREGIGSSKRGIASMLGMLLGYLAVIAILAGVAVFVVKRIFPRIGASQAGGRQIQVVETAHLGPRKTVFLLRVGSRKILVGSSREGMANLGDVTDALEEPRQTES